MIEYFRKKTNINITALRPLPSEKVDNDQILTLRTPIIIFINEE